MLIRAQPSLLHIAFKDAVGSCGSSGSPFMLCSLRSSAIRFSSELPLLWFSKERPSAVFLPSVSGPSRPLVKENDLRHLTAKSNTSSVPAVPPGFAGLLHSWPCRFVSPYFRPWGSGRFQPNLPRAALLRRLVPCVFLRPAYRTLRSVSLRDSRTASPQPLPPRR